MTGSLPAWRREYQDKGFACLPGVFNAEVVADLKAECERLWEQPELLDEGTLRTRVVGAQNRTDRLDPVIDVSDMFAALVTDDRILGPVAEILGEGPRLFKDKLIFKPPGARGYLCHQDYAYWQSQGARPEDLLSVIVCIDAADERNGAVEFFPQHDELLSEPGEVADVDESRLRVAGELVCTNPGDLVIFGSLTPHRSGTNEGSTTRRQVYLSYNSARSGNRYDSYYRDLHTALRSESPDGAEAT